MNDDILWHRFAEDTSLPEYLTAEEQKELEAIFSLENSQSPWSKALKNIGARIPSPPPQMIKWVYDYPYINKSFLNSIVSGGYTTSRVITMPSVIWSTMRLHWHSTSYLQTILERPLPDTELEKLEESLTLGLCILLLQQRLTQLDEEQLAHALKNPENLKGAHRKIIETLIKIQSRRNDLSAVWESIFKEKPTAKEIKTGPEAFWNHLPKKSEEKKKEHSTSKWKGIAVSGHSISAPIVIIDSLKEIPVIQKEEEPPILIFKQARAGTIQLFSKAAGIIYCNGGAMSHACSIAREQNVSCITAAGNDFWKEAGALKQNKKKVVVHMDTTTGFITFL